jgi:hypothetical protein
MDSERNGARNGVRLSRGLPIPARMRPALHKKARALARRGDLPADCLVISFFELNESGPMCWLQFSGEHDVRQTLAAPLAQVALDRGPGLAESSVRRRRPERRATTKA